MALRNLKLLLSCLCLLLAFSATAHAEDESSEDAEMTSTEDLPSESVMPSLDSPSAVKNRSMQFKSHFEFSLSQAWMLDEPFLNNSSQVLEVGYGLSERKTVGVKAIFYNSGISDYSQQFKSYAGTQFDKVPQPRSAYGAYLQDRLFYGKWSFSQEAVFPMTVETIYEVNAIDARFKTLWMLGAGVAQKTYFTPSFGIGLSYKLLLHQWVDPNSVNLQASENPQEADFQEHIRLSHNLELKAIFLF